MAVEDLTALAERWRRAGGSMGRVRVVADGARTIAGLPAEDRLRLARVLAERGAPELADRLVAGTGGAGSGTELTEVVRQLFSLERDELATLTQQLREHVAAAPSAPTPQEPTLTPPVSTAPTAAAPSPVTAPPSAPDTTTPDATTPDATAPDATAPDATTPDATTPDATHRDPVDLDALLAALAAARTAHERFVALRAVAGRTVTVGEVVALLDAVPGGWQRRRAALRVLTDGHVPDPAAGILDRFGRDADRIAVAAALVDAHDVEPESVTPYLPTRAADRLRRRTAT